MRLALSVLFFLSFGLPGYAGEDRFADLLKKLGAEEKSEREAAVGEMTMFAHGRYEASLPKLLEAYFEGEDPEVSVRCEIILRLLYKIHELQESECLFGVVLGWYIDHNGKNLSSRPMILQVSPGTPAEKAGFAPGDVVLTCNGKSYRTLDSRNELMRDLAIISPGVETTFEVMLSGDDKTFTSTQKMTRKTRVVKPMRRVDFNVPSRFREDDYQEWLLKQSEH